MNRIHAWIGSVALGLFLAAARGAGPLSTEFTYQGSMKQDGVPSTGTIHLRFQLWDALAGGTQIGGTLDQPTVVVEGGVFTTALDFGSAPFSGSARWLQVQVITNGGNTVVTLAPRQPMTAAPYALFARSVDGPNLTNLNAANITSGLLAATHMPAGGNWSLSSPLNFDSGTLTVDSANNRIGVGTAAPAAPLHIVGNWNAEDGALRVSGDKATIRMTSGPLGGDQSWMVHVGSDGPGNLGVYNRIAPTAWLNLISLAPSGNLGLGTTAPGRPLHIVNPSAFAARFQSSNPTASVIEFTSTSSNSTWEYGVTGSSPPFPGIILPPGSMYLHKQGNSFPAFRIEPDGQVKLGNGNPSGYFGVISSGTAILGTSGLTRGVEGYGPVHGIYSWGNFGASGTKSFQIDHPLDPENKYLLHYCSESPEPQNFYNGVVTLNALGEASIELPDYFSEINRDPRYALTPIGAAMPSLHIAQEIVGRTFHIAGGVPGKRVSWEVKAIRHDQWVRQRGAPVELDKPEHERGKYQHPEMYGKPDEFRIRPGN